MSLTEGEMAYYLATLLIHDGEAPKDLREKTQRNKSLRKHRRHA
jgi:hypothetical protein